MLWFVYLVCAVRFRLANCGIFGLFVGCVGWWFAVDWFAVLLVVVCGFGLVAGFGVCGCCNLQCV